MPAAQPAAGPGPTRPIRLSSGAREAHRAFELWLEPRLAPEGEFGEIADWASKLAGAILRIAGLLHLAGRAGEASPHDAPISAETMRDAILVGEYLLPHARAAFGLMGANEAVKDARDVLAWLVANGHVGRIVSRRDISEGTKRLDRGVDRLKLAIDELIDRGYLRELPTVPQAGPGRKPGPRYAVNPLTPDPRRRPLGTTDIEQNVDDDVEEEIL